jgi:endonuclease-8
MFGSYTINERKDRPERLRLEFRNGDLNFYSCAIRMVEEDLDELYDWTSDVMNEGFDKKAALKKLRAIPDTLVCDALLNQTIFSGVGNIIKNEVLFRIRVHPESTVGALPPKKLRELVDEAVNYSFDFLEWKKEYKLRAHWLAHNKRICPRDEIPYQKKHLGKTHRRSFFCEACQKLYQ